MSERHLKVTVGITVFLLSGVQNKKMGSKNLCFNVK